MGMENFKRPIKELSETELIQRAKYEMSVFERCGANTCEALIKALERHQPKDGECSCVGLSHETNCPEWTIPF